MNNINVTKMSSKGQIVIPSEMRKQFSKNEEFVIILNGKQIILKSVKDFSKNLKEDLIFARRTEEAYKRHEKGEFKSMEADDFLKELEKW
ncbi:MAG: AbrB/MazE/SpoVT family DNA-binding domain-containing protein [Nanoarchaeota archaeon]